MHPQSSGVGAFLNIRTVGPRIEGSVSHTLCRLRSATARSSSACSFLRSAIWASFCCTSAISSWCCLFRLFSSVVFTPAYGGTSNDAHSPLDLSPLDPSLSFVQTRHSINEVQSGQKHQKSNTCYGVSKNAGTETRLHCNSTAAPANSQALLTLREEPAGPDGHGVGRAGIRIFGHRRPEVGARQPDVFDLEVLNHLLGTILSSLVSKVLQQRDKDRVSYFRRRFAAGLLDLESLFGRFLSPLVS
jgi:hypothetical protein